MIQSVQKILSDTKFFEVVLNPYSHKKWGIFLKEK